MCGGTDYTSSVARGQAEEPGWQSRGAGQLESRGPEQQEVENSIPTSGHSRGTGASQVEQDKDRLGRTVNGKTYEEARTFMPEHARWILNNSKGGKQFSEGMIDYANYLRVMKKKEEKLLAPSSSSSNGEEDKDMNPEDWIDEEPTHDKQG